MRYETILETEHEKVPGTDVVADLDVYRDAVDGRYLVEIYYWSCPSLYCDEADRALQRIREDYPGRITVHDAGLPGCESYEYWRRQLEEGRIDSAYDDNGECVEERRGPQREG